MKLFRWIIGALGLAVILTLVIFKPLTCLVANKLPFAGFSARIIYIIVLACVLCIFRVWKGPTGADRVVAIDILGIMIIGLCAVLTITTGRSWYMDIGIAWALQSFISTLALSKYLEGRNFDE